MIHSGGRIWLSTNWRRNVRSIAPPTAFVTMIESNKCWPPRALVSNAGSTCMTNALRFEFVAYAADCDDPAWLVRFRLDLLAQPADVDIDDLGLAFVAGAPNSLQEVVYGND